MSTIPEQPCDGHSPTLESLGPYFFSQIFKQEEDGSATDTPVAAIHQIYQIKLFASDLGMDNVLLVVLMIWVELGTTEAPDGNNTEEAQRTKVGSATVSMTDTRVQDFQHVYRSCKIEQLDVESEKMLSKLEAFATMLCRIRSFCIENHAKHLAMAPVQGPCWFSGLLKPAGFELCGCERPNKDAGAGIQLCIDLTISPTKMPARVKGASPTDDPAVGESDEVKTAAKIADTPGHFPEKLYCMYWIRNGECDYMQSGCKYKHEIPVDEETRQRIGLGKIPQWFKDSPEYDRFLQQAERSATRTSNGVRSDKEDITAVRSSSRGLWRRGSEVSSHSYGRDRTTRQDSEAGQRFERGTYKPPGAMMSSGGSEMQGDTQRSPKIKVENVEESPRDNARSHGLSRSPAGSRRLSLFDDGRPSSRSASGYAPSTLPGRMKRRPSSELADVNDQRAGPGLKRART